MRRRESGRAGRSRPVLEALEGRQLLASATPYPAVEYTQATIAPHATSDLAITFSAPMALGPLSAPQDYLVEEFAQGQSSPAMPVTVTGVVVQSPTTVELQFLATVPPGSSGYFVVTGPGPGGASLTGVNGVRIGSGAHQASPDGMLSATANAKGQDYWFGPGATAQFQKTMTAEEPGHSRSLGSELSGLFGDVTALAQTGWDSVAKALGHPKAKAKPKPARAHG